MAYQSDSRNSNYTKCVLGDICQTKRLMRVVANSCIISQFVGEDMQAEGDNVTGSRSHHH